MDLLLGIDAGTTSVKAGLFSPDGRCLALARQEYQLSTPQASWAELDPEIYWQACVATVKKVLQEANVNAEKVSALSVSSQGETMIALDSNGKPLHPAIVWLDNRAVREAEELAEKFSKEAYRMTGIPEIIPTWTACKILWQKQNQPDAFRRVGKFLLVQDYLIYRLTGRYTTNGSVSCTSLYFDIVNDRWWQPILDEIGIGVDHLPELILPGEVAGNISKEASAQTGLSPATKVVGGGMDQSVGAIGAGNIRPGIVSETTGAALTIQVTIPSPDVDKNKVIPVYSHSVPKSYLFVPVCPTAGMAYKWFRDTFAAPEIAQAEKEGTDSYDLLSRMAAEVPAGCDGLVMLPHLMGAYSPDPNPAARGSFTGFSLSHTRGHFARSILEGVAFGLKRNRDVLQQAGVEVGEIRATGGAAKSALWNQIKANVCNLPVVTLRNEETALLGDAILAGVASGTFRTIDEGCEKMVFLKDKVMPSEEAEVYIASYQRYCELDRTLDDYYRRQYKNLAHL
jgi:sugar (pentulose or hexulose) kinase